MIKFSLAKKRNTILSFFMAHILSAFGYEFIFFIMTLRVYHLSKNALNVGIFTALTFFPRLFSPFYGTIVDQYPRERVFAVVSGLTGLMIIIMSYISNIFWIYSLWFFISIFLVFIGNVRAALMADILVKDNFLLGNSLILVSTTSAKILAPLLCGFVVIYVDLKYLLYFTGLVYFIVTLTCTMIKLPNRIQINRDKKLAAHILEGFQFIRRNPDLRFLFLIIFTRSLFLGLQTSSFVIYIKSYLARGDTDYGLFLTVIGVGSLLGSILGPWVAKRIKSSFLTIGGLGFSYGANSLLGLNSSYPIALIIVFFSFLVFYITVVALHSLRDKAITTNIRGNIYGSVIALLTIPSIISMLAGGYLATIYGVNTVLLVSGILALVSLGVISLNKEHAKANQGIWF
ncbi:MAG: MFS transporter [Desulfosporosinus sp.]